MNDPDSSDVRAQIQERLVQDLKDDKFVLYFQSIVPVAPSVVESPAFRQILVRFKDEEEGLMPPGTFIPMLDEQGLMPLLDRWVTEKAAHWIAHKQATLGRKPVPRCSITLSSDTLRRDQAFGDFAARRVHKQAVRPGSLLFEIPVWEAVNPSRSLIALIESLRAAGCSLVMSGFTGEESAFQLAETLGVVFVKIDGSLVSGVTRDAAGKARVVAIHEKCEELGMHTICPQVESSETLEVLRGIAVDYAQGFGIDRPTILE